ESSARERAMKPFVVNRYGRIVFPFNFFPELDFSIFETLEQFAAVIKRDFEEKAPSETDIVAGVDALAYTGRHDLLRDLALNLFWVNRYAMTMYDKRPTRWRDVPKTQLASLITSSPTIPTTRATAGTTSSNTPTGCPRSKRSCARPWCSTTSIGGSGPRRA